MPFDIGRSVAIAAPIIVIMFILGTSSVLDADSAGPDRSHRTDTADPKRRIRLARCVVAMGTLTIFALL